MDKNTKHTTGLMKLREKLTQPIGSLDESSNGPELPFSSLKLPFDFERFTLDTSVTMPNSDPFEDMKIKN